MEITVEDNLLYISLAERGQYKFKKTLTDIDGQLIYDQDENWIGVRLPVDERVNSLPFVPNQFVEKVTPTYRDLLFTVEAEPCHYYEQELIVDVTKVGIAGIEIIRYPSIPAGKLKWIESIAKVR